MSIDADVFNRSSQPQGDSQSDAGPRLDVDCESCDERIARVAAALVDAGLCGVELSVLEMAAIRNALQQAHGNRTHAARSLGISVRTLQRKLIRLSAEDRNGRKNGSPPEC